MMQQEMEVTYHLRRIGPRATRPTSANLIHFSRPCTTIGRNIDRADYFIGSTSKVQNTCISRLHARVVRQGTIHKLHDDSLNGVFINNIKIGDVTVLVEGDTVTFGHCNGRNIAPGTRQRQPDSEYQFMFERCDCPVLATQSNLPHPVPQVQTSACATQATLQPTITSSQRTVHLNATNATVSRSVAEVGRTRHSQSQSSHFKAPSGYSDRQQVVPSAQPSQQDFEACRTLPQPNTALKNQPVGVEDRVLPQPNRPSTDREVELDGISQPLSRYSEDNQVVEHDRVLQLTNTRSENHQLVNEDTTTQQQRIHSEDVKLVEDGIPESAGRNSSQHRAIEGERSVQHPGRHSAAERVSDTGETSQIPSVHNVKGNSTQYPPNINTQDPQLTEHDDQTLQSSDSHCEDQQVERNSAKLQNIHAQDQQPQEDRNTQAISTCTADQLVDEDKTPHPLSPHPENQQLGNTSPRYHSSCSEDQQLENHVSRQPSSAPPERQEDLGMDTILQLPSILNVGLVAVEEQTTTQTEHQDPEHLQVTENKTDELISKCSEDTRTEENHTLQSSSKYSSDQQEKDCKRSQGEAEDKTSQSCTEQTEDKQTVEEVTSPQPTNRPHVHQQRGNYGTAQPSREIFDDQLEEGDQHSGSELEMGEDACGNKYKDDQQEPKSPRIQDIGVIDYPSQKCWDQEIVERRHSEIQQGEESTTSQPQSLLSHDQQVETDTTFQSEDVQEASQYTTPTDTIKTPTVQQTVTPSAHSDHQVEKEDMTAKPSSDCQQVVEDKQHMSGANTTEEIVSFSKSESLINEMGDGNFVEDSIPKEEEKDVDLKEGIQICSQADGDKERDVSNIIVPTSDLDKEVQQVNVSNEVCDTEKGIANSTNDCISSKRNKEIEMTESDTADQNVEIEVNQRGVSSVSLSDDQEVESISQGHGAPELEEVTIIPHIQCETVSEEVSDGADYCANLQKVLDSEVHVTTDHKEVLVHVEYSNNDSEEVTAIENVATDHEVHGARDLTTADFNKVYATTDPKELTASKEYAGSAKEEVAVSLELQAKDPNEVLASKLHGGSAFEEAPVTVEDSTSGDELTVNEEVPVSMAELITDPSGNACHTAGHGESPVNEDYGAAEVVSALEIHSATEPEEVTDLKEVIASEVHVLEHVAASGASAADATEEVSANQVTGATDPKELLASEVHGTTEMEKIPVIEKHTGVDPEEVPASEVHMDTYPEVSIVGKHGAIDLEDNPVSEVLSVTDPDEVSVSEDVRATDLEVVPLSDITDVSKPNQVCMSEDVRATDLKEVSDITDASKLLEVSISEGVGATDFEVVPGRDSEDVRATDLEEVPVSDASKPKEVSISEDVWATDLEEVPVCDITDAVCDITDASKPEGVSISKDVGATDLEMVPVCDIIDASKPEGVSTSEDIGATDLEMVPVCDITDACKPEGVSTSEDIGATDLEMVPVSDTADTGKPEEVFTCEDVGATALEGVPVCDIHETIKLDEVSTSGISDAAGPGEVLVSEDISKTEEVPGSEVCSAAGIELVPASELHDAANPDEVPASEVHCTTDLEEVGVIGKDNVTEPDEVPDITDIEDIPASEDGGATDLNDVHASEVKNGSESEDMPATGATDLEEVPASDSDSDSVEFQGQFEIIEKHNGTEMEAVPTSEVNAVTELEEVLVNVETTDPEEVSPSEEHSPVATDIKDLPASEESTTEIEEVSVSEKHEESEPAEVPSDARKPEGVSTCEDIGATDLKKGPVSDITDTCKPNEVSTWEDVEATDLEEVPVCDIHETIEDDEVSTSEISDAGGPGEVLVSEDTNISKTEEVPSSEVCSSAGIELVPASELHEATNPDEVPAGEVHCTTDLEEFGVIGKDNVTEPDEVHVHMEHDIEDIPAVEDDDATDLDDVHVNEVKDGAESEDMPATGATDLEVPASDSDSDAVPSSEFQGQLEVVEKHNGTEMEAVPTSEVDAVTELEEVLVNVETTDPEEVSPSEEHSPVATDIKDLPASEESTTDIGEVSVSEKHGESEPAEISSDARKPEGVSTSEDIGATDLKKGPVSDITDTSKPNEVSTCEDVGATDLKEVPACDIHETIEDGEVLSSELSNAAGPGEVLVSEDINISKTEEVPGSEVCSAAGIELVPASELHDATNPDEVPASEVHCTTDLEEVGVLGKDNVTEPDEFHVHMEHDIEDIPTSKDDDATALDDVHVSEVKDGAESEDMPATGATDLEEVPASDSDSDSGEFQGQLEVIEKHNGTEMEAVPTSEVNAVTELEEVLVNVETTDPEEVSPSEEHSPVATDIKDLPASEESTTDIGEVSVSEKHGESEPAEVPSDARKPEVVSTSEDIGATDLKEGPVSDITDTIEDDEVSTSEISDAADPGEVLVSEDISIPKTEEVPSSEVCSATGIELVPASELHDATNPDEVPASEVHCTTDLEEVGVIGKDNVTEPDEVHVHMEHDIEDIPASEDDDATDLDDVHVNEVKDGAESEDMPATGATDLEEVPASDSDSDSSEFKSQLEVIEKHNGTEMEAVPTSEVNAVTELEEVLIHVETTDPEDVSPSEEHSPVATDTKDLPASEESTTDIEEVSVSEKHGEFEPAEVPISEINGATEPVEVTSSEMHGASEPAEVPTNEKHDTPTLQVVPTVKNVEDTDPEEVPTCEMVGSTDQEVHVIDRNSASDHEEVPASQELSSFDFELVPDSVIDGAASLPEVSIDESSELCGTTELPEVDASEEHSLMDSEEVSECKVFGATELEEVPVNEIQSATDTEQVPVNLEYSQPITHLEEVPVIEKHGATDLEEINTWESEATSLGLHDATEVLVCVGQTTTKPEEVSASKLPTATDLKEHVESHPSDIQSAVDPQEVTDTLGVTASDENSATDPDDTHVKEDQTLETLSMAYDPESHTPTEAYYPNEREEVILNEGDSIEECANDLQGKSPIQDHYSDEEVIPGHGHNQEYQSADVSRMDSEPVVEIQTDKQEEGIIIKDQESFYQEERDTTVVKRTAGESNDNAQQEGLPVPTRSGEQKDTEFLDEDKEGLLRKEHKEDQEHDPCEVGGQTVKDHGNESCEFTTIQHKHNDNGPDKDQPETMLKPEVELNVSNLENVSTPKLPETDESECEIANGDSMEQLPVDSISELPGYSTSKEDRTYFTVDVNTTEQTLMSVRTLNDETSTIVEECSKDLSPLPGDIPVDSTLIGNDKQVISPEVSEEESKSQVQTDSTDEEKAVNSCNNVQLSISQRTLTQRTLTQTSCELPALPPMAQDGSEYTLKDKAKVFEDEAAKEEITPAVEDMPIAELEKTALGDEFCSAAEDDLQLEETKLSVASLTDEEASYKSETDSVATEAFSSGEMDDQEGEALNETKVADESVDISSEDVLEDVHGKGSQETETDLAYEELGISLCTDEGENAVSTADEGSLSGRATSLHGDDSTDASGDDEYKAEDTFPHTKSRNLATLSQEDSSSESDNGVYSCSSSVEYPLEETDESGLDSETECKTKPSADCETEPLSSTVESPVKKDEKMDGGAEVSSLVEGQNDLEDEEREEHEYSEETPHELTVRDPVELLEEPTYQCVLDVPLATQSGAEETRSPSVIECVSDEQSPTATGPIQQSSSSLHSQNIAEAFEDPVDVMQLTPASVIQSVTQNHNKVLKELTHADTIRDRGEMPTAGSNCSSSVTSEPAIEDNRCLSAADMDTRVHISVTLIDETIDDETVDRDYGRVEGKEVGSQQPRYFVSKTKGADDDIHTDVTCTSEVRPVNETNPASQTSKMEDSDVVQTSEIAITEDIEVGITPTHITTTKSTAETMKGESLEAWPEIEVSSGNLAIVESPEAEAETSTEDTNVVTTSADTEPDLPLPLLTPNEDTIPVPTSAHETRTQDTTSVIKSPKRMISSEPLEALSERVAVDENPSETIESNATQTSLQKAMKDVTLEAVPEVGDGSITEPEDTDAVPKLTKAEDPGAIIVSPQLTTSEYTDAILTSAVETMKNGPLEAVHEIVVFENLAETETDTVQTETQKPQTTSAMMNDITCLDFTTESEVIDSDKSAEKYAEEAEDKLAVEASSEKTVADEVVTENSEMGESNKPECESPGYEASSELSDTDTPVKNIHIAVSTSHSTTQSGEEEEEIRFSDEGAETETQSVEANDEQHIEISAGDKNALDVQEEQRDDNLVASESEVTKDADLENDTQIVAEEYEKQTPIETQSQTVDTPFINTTSPEANGKIGEQAKAVDTPDIDTTAPKASGEIGDQVFPDKTVVLPVEPSVGENPASDIAQIDDNPDKAVVAPDVKNYDAPSTAISKCLGDQKSAAEQLNKEPSEEAARDESCNKAIEETQRSVTLPQQEEQGPSQVLVNDQRKRSTATVGDRNQSPYSTSVLIKPGVSRVRKNITDHLTPFSSSPSKRQRLDSSVDTNNEYYNSNEVQDSVEDGQFSDVDSDEEDDLIYPDLFTTPLPKSKSQNLEMSKTERLHEEIYQESVNIELTSCSNLNVVSSKDVSNFVTENLEVPKAQEPTVTADQCTDGSVKSVIVNPDVDIPDSHENMLEADSDENITDVINNPDTDSLMPSTENEGVGLQKLCEEVAVDDCHKDANCTTVTMKTSMNLPETCVENSDLQESCRQLTGDECEMVSISTTKIDLPPSYHQASQENMELQEMSIEESSKSEHVNMNPNGDFVHPCQEDVEKQISNEGIKKDVVTTAINNPNLLEPCQEILDSQEQNAVEKDNEDVIVNPAKDTIEACRETLISHEQVQEQKYIEEIITSTDPAANIPQKCQENVDLHISNKQLLGQQDNKKDVCNEALLNASPLASEDTIVMQEPYLQVEGEECTEEGVSTNVVGNQDLVQPCPEVVKMQEIHDQVVEVESHEAIVCTDVRTNSAEAQKLVGKEECTEEGVSTNLDGNQDLIQPCPEVVEMQEVNDQVVEGESHEAIVCTDVRTNASESQEHVEQEECTEEGVSTNVVGNPDVIQPCPEVVTIEEVNDQVVEGESHEAVVCTDVSVNPAESHSHVHREECTEEVSTNVVGNQDLMQPCPEYMVVERQEVHDQIVEGESNEAVVCTDVRTNPAEAQEHVGKEECTEEGVSADVVGIQDLMQPCPEVVTMQEVKYDQVVGGESHEAVVCTDVSTNPSEPQEHVEQEECTEEVSTNVVGNQDLMEPCPEVVEMQAVHDQVVEVESNEAVVCTDVSMNPAEAQEHVEQEECTKEGASTNVVGNPDLMQPCSQVVEIQEVHDQVVEGQWNEAVVCPNLSRNPTEAQDHVEIQESPKEVLREECDPNEINSNVNPDRDMIETSQEKQDSSEQIQEQECAEEIDSTIIVNPAGKVPQEYQENLEVIQSPAEVVEAQGAHDHVLEEACTEEVICTDISIKPSEAHEGIEVLESHEEVLRAEEDVCRVNPARELLHSPPKILDVKVSHDHVLEDGDDRVVSAIESAISAGGKLQDPLEVLEVQPTPDQVFERECNVEVSCADVIVGPAEGLDVTVQKSPEELLREECEQEDICVVNTATDMTEACQKKADSHQQSPEHEAIEEIINSSKVQNQAEKLPQENLDVIQCHNEVVEVQELHDQVLGEKCTEEVCTDVSVMVHASEEEVQTEERDEEDVSTSDIVNPPTQFPEPRLGLAEESQEEYVPEEFNGKVFCANELKNPAGDILQPLPEVIVIQESNDQDLGEECTEEVICTDTIVNPADVQEEVEVQKSHSEVLSEECHEVICSRDIVNPARELIEPPTEVVAVLESDDQVSDDQECTPEIFSSNHIVTPAGDILQPRPEVEVHESHKQPWSQEYSDEDIFSNAIINQDNALQTSCPGVVVPQQSQEQVPGEECTEQEADTNSVAGPREVFESPDTIQAPSDEQDVAVVCTEQDSSIEGNTDADNDPDGHWQNEDYQYVGSPSTSTTHDDMVPIIATTQDVCSSSSTTDRFHHVVEISPLTASQLDTATRTLSLPGINAASDLSLEIPPSDGEVIPDSQHDDSQVSPIIPNIYSSSVPSEDFAANEPEMPTTTAKAEPMFDEDESDQSQPLGIDMHALDSDEAIPSAQKERTMKRALQTDTDSDEDFAPSQMSFRTPLKKHKSKRFSQKRPTPKPRQTKRSQPDGSDDEDTIHTRPSATPSRVDTLLSRVRAKRQRTQTTTDSESDSFAREQPVAAAMPDMISPRLQQRRSKIDSAEEYVTRAAAIIDEAKGILESNGKLSSNQRVNTWQDELRKLEETATLPETVIAVVGDTGAGKSSIMNALIGHASVLPTSGMQACTAVVVEVKDNPNSNYYEGEIQFLEKDEWYRELDTLLKELQGADGQVRACQPDPNSDLRVAWNKVRAVYGSFPDGVTRRTLPKMTHITSYLGRTKTVRENNPLTFKKKVESYIASTNCRDGGQFWPIVKKVSLRIPNCSVCSSGATLVDLPGIRDSNAARDKIAKEYLQRCTAVWVVASIHRAVDDKTAKELLGEHFRRQLLMDGQYGSVSFVCTKTDIHSPSELISGLDLDLNHEITHFEEEIEDLTREDEDVKEDIKWRSEEVKRLKTQISVLRSKKKDFQSDLMELEAALQEEDPEEDKKEEISKLKRNLEKLVTQTENEMKALKEKMREHIQEIEARKNKIHELEKDVASRRKSISTICVLARNQFAKTEIRRDFKAGLREMKRRAGMTDDTQDEEDEFESESEDDDDVKRTTNNLKVFCVSSTEYLKLNGLLPSVDGPSLVFQTVKETGVPELEQHVHVMTGVRRQQGTEQLICSVHQCVQNVESYLMDEGTKTERTRGDAKGVIGNQIRRFKKRGLADVHTEIMGHIHSLFQSSLKKKIDEGKQTAIERADTTVAKWGAKQSKEKGEGGLHFSTYKAAVRRDGVFKSPIAGNIDFNEALTNPVLTSMSIVWDRVFNMSLSDHLEDFKKSIIAKLALFVLELQGTLQSIGVAVDRLQRTEQHLKQRVDHTVSVALTETKAFIADRQREINRVVTPKVQERMKPVYDRCSAETGPGTFNRMKGHVQQHVADGKTIFFNESTRWLYELLHELQEQIKGMLDAIIDRVIADCEQVLEPYWEEPCNTKAFRVAFLQGIKNCLDKITKLSLDARVALPVVPQPRSPTPSPPATLASSALGSSSGEPLAYSGATLSCGCYVALSHGAKQKFVNMSGECQIHCPTSHSEQESDEAAGKPSIVKHETQKMVYGDQKPAVAADKRRVLGPVTPSKENIPRGGETKEKTLPAPANTQSGRKRSLLHASQPHHTNVQTSKPRLSLPKTPSKELSGVPVKQEPGAPAPKKQRPIDHGVVDLTISSDDDDDDDDDDELPSMASILSQNRF